MKLWKVLGVYGVKLSTCPMLYSLQGPVASDAFIGLVAYLVPNFCTVLATGGGRIYFLSSIC